MPDEIIFRSIEEMWLAPPEEINCIIEPGLLPTGGLMVVTGEPGVGKSFLLQQMSFELATGRRLLGIFPVKREKTVYFNFEKPTPIARARFLGSRWKNKYPDSIGYLHYYDKYKPDLTNPRDVQIFKKALVNYGCKIAIIDSFSVLIDDELSLREQKRLITSCREIAVDLEMGIIIILHLKKKGVDYNSRTGTYHQSPLQLNDLKGNKTIQYEVDTIMGLVKGSKPDQKDLGFLKHSFSHSQLVERPPIEFDFDGESAVPFKSIDKHLGRVISTLDLLDSVSFVNLETILGVTRPTLISIIEDLNHMGLVKEKYVGREKFLESFKGFK